MDCSGNAVSLKGEITNIGNEESWAKKYDVKSMVLRN